MYMTEDKREEGQPAGPLSGKDKGGPSEGGFLNNRLIS